MKKVLSCILMAIVALSFAACGGSKSNNNASKIVGKWHYEDQWATEIISFNSDNTCQMRVIYNGKNTPYDVEGTIFYKYDEDTNVLEMHKDGDPTFNYQNSFIKLRWDNDNCLYLLYSDYQNEVGPFVRL